MELHEYSVEFHGIPWGIPHGIPWSLRRKFHVFLKPGPHQQQCRSNVRRCCQNGNNVERVLRWNFVLSTKSNVASKMLPKTATLSKQQATKLPVASTLLLVWTGLYGIPWGIKLGPPFGRIASTCVDFKHRECANGLRLTAVVTFAVKHRDKYRHRD